MATLYRIEMIVPATKKKEAFSLVFDQRDNRVQSVECELKKDKKKVSFFTCTLADSDGKVITDIPDPAFVDVDLTFSFAPQDKQTPEEVFSGKVTSLHFQWGAGLSTTTVTAKDKRVMLARKAKVRTYKGQTVRQIVDAVCKEYGITTDWDVGDVNMVARAIEFGIPGFGAHALSDWAFCRRMLASVGLDATFRKGKLQIRQLNTETYPITFRPGDGRVISLDATINHVRSPGDLGNVSTTAAFDYGKEKAARGDAAKEAALAKGGEGETFKKPIGGAKHGGTNTHAENHDATQWSNVVTRRRGRKDEATLTVNATPGVFPSMLIPLDGWGGKIDGTWEADDVKHDIFNRTTTIHMKRGTSSGSASSSGSPAFDYGR